MADWLKRGFQKSVRYLLPLLLFCFASLLLFTRSMHMELLHDEHQFIASAALLAREGLLPYLDYPYHHLPNLVFLYGLLFRNSHLLLLTARIVSTLASIGSATLICVLVMRAYLDSSPLTKILAPMSAVFIYIFDPLTAFTSGAAWNHDIPIFLSLAAFAVLADRGNSEVSKARLFAAGGLIGLATGTRLSFAILLVPAIFHVVPRWTLKPTRIVLSAGAMLSSSFLLAMTPSIWLFVRDPRSFIFGNFVYPKLNYGYRAAVRHRIAMTIHQKLSFLIEKIALDPANAIIAISILMALIVVLLSHHGRHQGDLRRHYFAFSSAIWLLIAALVPTPTWYQYFFAPLPFFILSFFYGLKALPDGHRLHPALVMIMLLIAALTVPSQDSLSQLSRSSLSQTPAPIQVHDAGLELANLVPGSRILTLAPIYPLEGGLSIDPAFITGPFTWRTSVLLSAERREYYNVISPAEIQDHLNQVRPDAILLGTEASTPGFGYGDAGGLERPFREYAISHHYRRLTVAADPSVQSLELWVDMERSRSAKQRAVD